ncbi:FUSC family protein [Nakamurella flava]|uniref:FUSC family protein n=1 Tax=Nakamurella flava TaxID=2576308 RepID=UPI001409D735|nr:aromatic acid exporter family protein [Nakamurella flava]
MFTSEVGPGGPGARPQSRVRRLLADTRSRLRVRGAAAFGRALRLSGAAVAAFVVALAVFPSTVPILAPLTALLVVEVTLKDILASGLQRIASVTLGVLVAVGFSAYVGLSWWSLGVLLAVAIMLGQLLRLGPHALEVPISAMLVLAVGGSEAAASDRIFETLVGAGVGVLVNVVLPPAVRPRRAAESVDRFARELARLLAGAAAELRDPITQAQAVRWMEAARELSRQLPKIDAGLQELADSRRLNPRALGVPDTGANLRGELEALEHTTIAVRSMFRSILDGVRDDPNPDPAAGEDRRRIFAALVADVAVTVAAVGSLARAEGTDGEADRAAVVATTLATLRDARDRIDELASLRADPAEEGWQLTEPVRVTVHRVLRDLDEAVRQRVHTRPPAPGLAGPVELVSRWRPRRGAPGVGPARRGPHAPGQRLGPHSGAHPGRPGRRGGAEATGGLRPVGRSATETGAFRPVLRSVLETGTFRPVGRSAVETSLLRVVSPAGGSIPSARPVDGGDASAARTDRLPRLVEPPTSVDPSGR